MSEGSGYSLVELLTTVAILGVLSLFSLPPLAAWRLNAAAQGQARMFAADLQRMRIQATKFNCPVVMLLDETGYMVFVDDGEGGAAAGDWQMTGSETLTCRRSFNKNVQIDHTFTANRLRFQGAGGNKTGRMIFTAGGGKRYEVVLSVLGRIRISGS